ncbi:hypothetical protein RND59_19405 [Vibrio ruber]|uniref:hypothetical protein n=1 Tax=Vibrio ruber TaxID=184755 RepID=UPI0028936399|nr:hypothetical protein [Vibrio ruber]WNJ97368.1 hypothetical protein RND59_19405 [Vibrio ruber]
MHLNIIPTTWIAILALAAQLMSGFAFSSTMMDSAMPHGNQAATSSCPSFQKMSSHHQSMDIDNSMNVQCEVQADMIHECCDSTCTTSAAILITPNTLFTANISLALFTALLSGDVVHQTQSLYRPPIA